MPFTDKQGLEAEVVAWMARDDITPNVGSCIALAEAYFNRRLRVRQQESVIQMPLTAGKATMPDDYLAWRRLTWTGSPNRDLEYVVPSALTLQFPNNAEGTPRKFTIEGGFLSVRPIDDANKVEFNYFAKVPSLDQPTDTNWLLREYPDVYLTGTLAWVNTLVQNTEQFQLWITACDQIIERAMQLSEKTKGPSAIQIAGPTP